MAGGHDSTPRATAAARPTPQGSTPAATAATASAETPHARLHALVISDKLVASYPLPDSGELHIGRAPHSEILIDDPSISRNHATLTIGPKLFVRDLGSANGTRVRERQVPSGQSCEIVPGEAVQVGAATIILQRLAVPIRARRVWAHDYFEVRLEEECARAARKGSPFAVVRLTCTSTTTPAALQDALTDVVRLSDVVGEYGPNDYEILMVDTDADEVEQAVARLVAMLENHGVRVRIGAACYPRDGRATDELMARASARARGDKPTSAVDGGGKSAVVVADRTMQELYNLAARIAGGTISVLILGETGVGKEVLAQRVHTASPRASRPYLRLNCAALSESLLESELFGHERGAFTGAVAAKQGLLETADGGSVFLDEVGELPHAIQVKLLRVIEERVVLRVGGLKPRPLDVRFIAATNRDLEAEVERGTFRQDLFFRLNGATLVIPPLRDRPSEIPALARAFLVHGARQAGLTTTPKLSSDAEAALLRYSWPGNIRELRNVIERAVLLSGGDEILPRHFPLEKMRVTFATSSAMTRPAAVRPAAPPTPPPPEPATPVLPVASVLRHGPRMSRDDERAQIEAALAACGGNQTRAAKMLGIARRTLINRVREFGLARPRGR